MSWINSNATYKQNSKNDLSFYHGFSKTPVEPNTSTGNAATTLANASTKGGHTVIGTEVWAEEIPWFGLVPSRAVAVTRLSGLTKLNDLVKVDGEGGKVYKYKGADDATFTEDTWADFWEEITLTNGMTLNNRHKQPVLRYYLNQPMQTLTTTNNASIDSKGYATRLFVNESDHTGQTSGGSVVSQFAAGTDNIKNGIPSVELNPKLYLGTTEKIAGTHYYDYNVSGTILWSTAVTSSSPKISCFRYIGKTVTGQFATVESAISQHATDISDIKLALGIEDTPEDPNASSVTERVKTVEDVVRVLLGLGDDTAITASESISATATSAINTALAEGGSIAQKIAAAKNEALEAIDAIQHFAVEIVPEGQTIENVTPLVENTIYLVKDANAAEGTYIEYIAYKPAGSETVVTEKIGSTAIDLSGYTTDGEHAALAERVTALDTAATGRVSVVESEINTLKTTTIPAAITTAQDYTDTKIADELKDSGSIATAINTAKQAAIDNAKVTLTAGTGITIPNSGTLQTAFNISVDTEVIATKQSVDDLSALVSGVSQTVASNKTDLEGQITTAQTTLQSSIDSVSGRVTTLETETVPGIDTRLQNAEATITSLTTGNASVDSKVNAVKTELQGKIDEINTSLTTGAIHSEIDGVREIANAAKATADTAVQSVTRAPGSSTLLTVTDGTDATISLSTEVATKTDITTEINKLSAADGAITTLSGKVSDIETSLATGGETAEAIAAAKKTGTDAQTTADAKVADVTVDGTSIVSGAAGAKTAALTTTNGVEITPNAESASTALATEASVAKALASITSVGVSYEVIPDGQTHTSITTPVNGRIYLEKDDTDAEAGIYIEWMYTEKGWEQIGSTKTDHSTYASTITVNGLPKTVSESSVDLGAFASSVTAGNGVASGSVSNTGALSLTLTIASTETAGITQLTADYNDEEDDKAATGKSIAAAIETLDSTKSVNGITVTQTNGVIESITEELIAASVPAGTTSVEGNVAYVGSTKHIISPEKFETAAQMSASLTSWVADLSNLTVGDNMFKGCTGLTVFVGDLSSLTSGVDMFNGCTLDSESLEILAENLPTVSGGTIDIGASTNATDEVIATIKGKGWTVNSNGTAL